MTDKRGLLHSWTQARLSARETILQADFSVLIRRCPFLDNFRLADHSPRGVVFLGQ